MTELQLYNQLVTAMFVLAAAVFVILQWITAPYGRHVRSGWGPTIPARVAWIVMESPAMLLFAVIFAAGRHAVTIVPLVFLAMWQLHYINRTAVYPFRMRSAGKRMPITIVAVALVFNCVMSYINARWISHFGEYQSSWLTSPPFLIGVICFLTGWAINQHADSILLRLRSRSNVDYAIPQGGLYRWVSCPNYLGEMLEWAGWALATWSLAGAAFAVFTAANLLPRALANHRWYGQRFPDYPASRRAVIPFLL